MKFKVGDIVSFRMNPDTRRIITEVRPTGYTYSYVEAEHEHFTEDGSDPYLENWDLVEPVSLMRIIADHEQRLKNLEAKEK